MNINFDKITGKGRNESFMLIGMSTFSRFLARYLSERNFEVVAIDQSEDRIEKVKPFVTKGIIGDAKDASFLEKAGVKDVDAVIVSLGRKADDSLLIVYHLHELEVENIYVKVVAEDHAKILKKIGDCEIIFPEQESALRLAQRIDNPNILDYIPLTDSYSIIDWTPNEEFIGKTLGELNLKSEFGVQVISIEDAQKKVKLIPKASHYIKQGDVLVVIGENEHLEKLKEQK
ncbi:potassium channel family protein [Marinoscillum furvescens]|uniref:Trk system potassium uptake protein TrkA n=1 Tax=Marinoscillum furvescens DSM 4134 TaxID=1122208 RepID=A0A3D9KXX0_MARFU|nr:TrkA family potassium uptake protein [Marinoscillum furvescens]RED92049.1 trk system potassium uptake protein TrkA [Marinoscillum furvescens DSM 4134]